MTRWDLFAGFIAVVTLGIVVLSQASAELVTDEQPPARRMPTIELLANVAFSQGLLGGVLVFAAWYASVPGEALGLGWSRDLLVFGVIGGIALYVGDELLAVLAAAVGIPYSEALRELLAPETIREWAMLLGVVLPIIAGFEELLFRGALIGALAAGYGVSPWFLAVVSSLVFGYAHGAQGVGGMAVTALLGFALAAIFVVSGSLLVAVIAHYLVNALEFVVHEGLGVTWTDREVS